MVPNHEESTQEEVYLAAMMYHIGETSFWSTGLPITDKLIENVDMPEADFQRYCASVTGVRFQDISIGLAKRWNLGDLLVKALDNPQARAVEMNIINLANRLTSAISAGQSGPLMDKLLKEMSGIMKIDVAKVKKHIESTRDFATEMLNSYGASVLTSYIKPLPLDNSNQEAAPIPVIAQLSTEQGLLAMTKEINQLVKNKGKINDFLVSTLRNIAIVLDFEQCSFWALNKERNRLDCRMTFDEKGQPVMLSGSVSVGHIENVFSHALKKDEATEIDITRMDHVAISADLEAVVNRGPLCIFPIKLNDRPIGLVSAQMVTTRRKLDPYQVAHLSFVLDHLNLCLSMAAMR